MCCRIGLAGGAPLVVVAPEDGSSDLPRRIDRIGGCCSALENEPSAFEFDIKLLPWLRLLCAEDRGDESNLGD